jgi:hypothetical protein
MVEQSSKRQNCNIGKVQNLRFGPGRPNLIYSKRLLINRLFPLQKHLQTRDFMAFRGILVSQQD